MADKVNPWKREKESCAQVLLSNDYRFSFFPKLLRLLCQEYTQIVADDLACS